MQKEVLRGVGETSEKDRSGSRMQKLLLKGTEALITRFRYFTRSLICPPRSGRISFRPEDANQCLDSS